MEQKVKGPEPVKVDYEKYVVRKQLEEYWRVDEKVTLVMLGLFSQILIIMFCKLNNVFFLQFYEWREYFIVRGCEGLCGNGG